MDRVFDEMPPVIIGTLKLSFEYDSFIKIRDFFLENVRGSCQRYMAYDEIRSSRHQSGYSW